MNRIGDQGQGQEPHGLLRLETESCDGQRVEIAIPPPQPPECGCHAPAIRSRRGKRPSATAPRNKGSGYRANGASTRTAVSGIGEKITITVVQKGARRKAATLQRTPRPSARRASFGSSVAQSTSR